MVEIDEKTGKLRLSHRALLPKPEGYEEKKPNGPRPGGPRPGGHGNGNHGGGNRNGGSHGNGGNGGPRRK